MEEDMTDIPAEYTDKNLFLFYNNMFGEEIYTFWFMFENFELYTVGVQSFYHGADDELYSSQLINVNPGFYEDPSKIVSIVNAEEISVEYYDISGVKIEHPSSGLYIKVSKMADGSRKTEKVAL